MPELPIKLAVDADGYVWRIYQSYEEKDTYIWSVAPVNEGNEPIPEPITWYVRQDPLGRPRKEPDEV